MAQRFSHSQFLTSFLALGLWLLAFDGLAGQSATPCRTTEKSTPNLALRTLTDGMPADGALIEVPEGMAFTAASSFLHFRDRSIRDETAIFSQRGRLLSARLVQKGPTFHDRRSTCRSTWPAVKSWFATWAMTAIRKWRASASICHRISQTV